MFGRFCWQNKKTKTKKDIPSINLVLCYIIWKYEEILYDQQINFDWDLHFPKTVEQSNKKTAKLITLVSGKFDVTIETKHSLRKCNYSNIISVQNSYSALSQFLPLTSPISNSLDANISLVSSGNISLTHGILSLTVHR